MYVQRSRLYVLAGLFVATLLAIWYNGWRWRDLKWKIVNSDAKKLLGDQLGSSEMRSFSSDVRRMFVPIVSSTSAPYFDVDRDRFYGITEPAIWSSLGSDVCIADIDTRHFDKDGQLLSDTFRWSSADTLSTGMLNHFLYASIHGYTYHFINTTPWPNGDRDNVWTKVPQLRRLLDVCRIVAVLDSDVVIQHLELPFEWLLNRWNFTKEHSMAMPFDTASWVDDDGNDLLDIPLTHDSTGLLSINGGVVIAQSSPRTKEMIDAWIACPEDEERFPGCGKLAHGWPAEQGAFAEYIRHAFDRPSDMLHIPCDEANGYPGQHMNCSGIFMRHYTSDKDSVKVNVGQTLLDAVTSVFASHFTGGTRASEHG